MLIHSTFYRIFRIILFLALTSAIFPLISHAQENAKPGGAATVELVRNEAVLKGLKVEFSVTPVGTREVMEGEYAIISFRITDSTTGALIKAANPSAWMDIRGEASGEEKVAFTCRDKISLFLRGNLGMRPSLDLNSYYIMALNKDSTITIIDPITGVSGITSLYARILLERPGADWAKSRDRNRLYITMPRANRVAVVNTETFKIETNLDSGENPVRIALQPDEKYLWVGNNSREEEKSGVTVIDTGTLRVVTQVKTGKGHHEIVFSDDSHYAFVSNRDSGTVSVIDVRQMKKIKDMKTGPLPISLAYSQLSQALYVADSNTGEITVVDGKSHEVIKNIEAKPGLGPQRITPEGRWDFIINSSEDTVYILDTSTNQLIHKVSVGEQPYQISLTREFAYVRNLGTSRVSMISLHELRKGRDPIVNSFPAGASIPKSAGELGLAPMIVPSAEESAVLVVNPADSSIDYYMEGMNTSMGTFQNYGHPPIAVEIADRSLKENEEGVYSTKIKIPAAGTYDVAFMMHSPDIVHCFSAQAKANPLIQHEEARLKVEYLIKDRKVMVGEQVSFRFSLIDPKSRKPLTGVRDLAVRYFVSPGIMKREVPASEVEEGVYEAELTITRSGAYYVYIASPSLKIKYADLPFLSLHAIQGKVAVESAE